MLGWVRPGLPVLSNLVGPIQFFFSLRFSMFGGTRLLLTFVRGKGLEAVRFGILLVPCSSLILLTSETDKALLRGILVGGVWNGFLLGGVRGQPVPCRFWCMERF